MKKNYVGVAGEVILLASKDIITASVDRVVYDPNGILNDKADAWEW